MKSLRKNQSGFTLMEIVVSTTIFASTVTLMLGLFTAALRINRRVESLRQVAQGTRNFTETLTREIRNGRVEYSTFGNCAGGNYAFPVNKTLGLATFSGDKLCLYLDENSEELVISKTVNGTAITESINPKNFKIKKDSFRFVVRPWTNPKTSPYKGIQPTVTIFAEFVVNQGNGEPPTVLPYQTTISTDVYDIPPKP